MHSDITGVETDHSECLEGRNGVDDGDLLILLTTAALCRANVCFYRGEFRADTNENHVIKLIDIFKFLAAGVHVRSEIWSFGLRRLIYVHCDNRTDAWAPLPLILVHRLTCLNKGHAAQAAQPYIVAA